VSAYATFCVCASRCRSAAPCLLSGLRTRFREEHRRSAVVHLLHFHTASAHDPPCDTMIPCMSRPIKSLKLRDLLHAYASTIVSPYALLSILTSGREFADGQVALVRCRRRLPLRTHPLCFSRSDRSMSRRRLSLPVLLDTLSLAASAALISASVPWTAFMQPVSVTVWRVCAGASSAVMEPLT
jgi:hypothetical protein